MADNSLTPKEEFLLNPVTEHNITDAAIATFETNLRHPVKVEVPLAPIQDLHGMDSPYPAGASVNLIPDTTDTSNGYVAGYYLKNDNTTVTGINWYISEYFEVDPSITYTWSDRVNTSTDPSICFYDENKNYISGIALNNQYSHTFTPPEGAVYARSSQVTYTYQAANPTGQAFQLEVGSTATSYKRYSNICPIEGFDKANVFHDSSGTGEHGTYTFSYSQAGNGTPTETNIRPITPGMSLVRDNGTMLNIASGRLVLNNDGTSKLIRTWAFYVLDGVTNRATSASSQNYGLNIAGHYTNNKDYNVYSSHYQGQSYTHRNNAGHHIHVSSSSGALRIRDTTQPARTVAEFNEFLKEQVRLGTPVQVAALVTEDNYNLSVTETIRALAYLGLQSQAIPITFTNPSTGDPLTVYGGTVTLNEDGSADLVAKYTGRKMTDLTWTYNSKYKCFESSWITEPVHGANVLSCYCSMYKAIPNSAYPTQDLTINFNSTSASNKSYFRLIDLSCNGSVEAFNAKILEADGFLCWWRHTNIYTVFHFPNVGQLKAFLGTNNVWSDFGNVNVKYLTQNTETGMEYRGDRALELRRRAMLADAPTIHTTVGSAETSGLASFKSYVKAPVKSVTIPFTPKQDLHGYDHPWPGGGGKNLFDKTDTSKRIAHSYLVAEVGDLCQNVTTINDTRIVWVNCEANTTYTVSCDVTTTLRLASFENFPTADRTAATVFNAPSTTTTAGTGISLTTGPNDSYLFIQVFADDDMRTITFESATNKLMVEKGSTATAYAPYENLCPIEGWNGCEIKDSKDSFYKSAGTNYVNNQYGVRLITNDSIRLYRLKGTSAYVSSKQLLSVYNLELGKTYRVSADATIVSGSARIAIRNANNTMIRSTDRIVSAGNHHLELVFVYDDITELNYLSFFATFGETSGGDVTYSNIKFAEVVTLPITFTDPTTGDPMTIYGGTVTINDDGSADVVSKMRRSVLTGTENWSSQAATTTYNRKYIVTLSLMGSRSLALNSSGKTSYIKTISTHNDYKNDGPLCAIFGWSDNKLYIMNADQHLQGVSDLASFKEYLSMNNLEILYPLASPISYHFSNLEQLRVWLGENNFWCDISDDITVKYWNRGFGN